MDSSSASRTLGLRNVFPLALGTNIFGSTIGRAETFAVLDAFVDAGGNLIDTAHTYTGGRSEALIGEWLKERGHHEGLVIATKGGWDSADGESLRSQVESSLERLGVDSLDLFYVHRDQPERPLREILETLNGFVEEGKVRRVAASNFTASRLAEALAIADREGLPRFAALEPEYSLIERESYEGPLAEVCEQAALAVTPYWALARGFLTGKYRPGGPEIDSPRAEKAGQYLDPRGIAVLDALDETAAAHDTTVASVALAWTLLSPAVIAPIVSARNPEQLADLLPAAELELTEADAARLDRASRTPPR